MSTTVHALRGGVIQKIILDLNSVPQKSLGPDDMHKLTITLTTTFPPWALKLKKSPL